MCCFVMLNPSTADETTDDPTIRRCIGFATDWGHAALTVVNLYSLRATRPADLFASRARLGADDDRVLLEHAERADFVLAAWGAHGTRDGRGAEVMSLLAKAQLTVHALGLTKNGQPRHPLYARRAARPLVILDRGELRQIS
jgi:hypothetical protein